MSGRGKTGITGERPFVTGPFYLVNRSPDSQSWNFLLLLFFWFFNIWHSGVHRGPLNGRRKRDRRVLTLRRDPSVVESPRPCPLSRRTTVLGQATKPCPICLFVCSQTSIRLWIPHIFLITRIVDSSYLRPSKILDRRNLFGGFVDRLLLTFDKTRP